MSDLLTRLAERALGRAAPALEPRLPSRYADAPAAGDAFFSEVSAEAEAPSIRPRMPHAPAPGAAHHPIVPSHPRETAAPAAPPTRPSPRGAAEATASSDRLAAAPRPAAGPRPPSVAGDRAETGDAPAGDARPLARRAESTAPHPPIASLDEPARTAGDAIHVIESFIAAPKRHQDPRPAESGRDLDRDGAAEDGLREVVTVVERGAADGETRPAAAAPATPALARREAPHSARIVPVRATPAPAIQSMEREREEERPVIRVTIGRIEVRAAPQPPAPQPAPRRGWAPPVMPLDDYLKREAGR